MHLTNYRIICRPANLLIAFVFLYIILYFSTIKRIIQFWIDGSGTYSHGLLLFSVSLFYFGKVWWQQRNAIVISFSWPGFALLLLFSFVWLASKIIFVDTSELLGLPFILASVFLALIGWRQSKKFLFPILLLLLALPLFDWIIPILQRVTAVSAGFLLEVMNVTSVVEGVLILVPAGTFEVDGGCSGLNVFLVGTILALLYSYVNNCNLKGWLILLTLTMGFSVIANVIRVTIIVIVGNETQMQHPLVEAHENLGWVVFLFIMGIFYFIVDRVWLFPQVYKQQDVKLIKTQIHTSERNTTTRINVIWGLIIFAGLSFAPMLASKATHQSPDHQASSYIIPNQFGEWKKTDNYTRDWDIKFVGGEGDVKINRMYSNEKLGDVYLNCRFYYSQKVGNEAVNQSNSVYDRKNWTRVWVRSSGINGTKILPDSIEETLVRNKNNNEVLVWRWYSILGINTGNPYKAKLYNLAAVLMGKPETAVFVISTKVTQSRDDSRQRLTNFSMAISQGADKK